MATLPPERIEHLLQAYVQNASTPPPVTLFPQLSTYLDLLLKWNGRTNLTAIRDPETIVTRHFGESLFLACHLPPGTRTVLDLGSGAGFPGLPLQLLRPDLAVTLAESQHKKSAFLREAIRSLGLSTVVHADRAETLLGRSPFDVVTLRAVDRMRAALALASQLGRTRLVLTTEAELGTTQVKRTWPLPFSEKGVVAQL